MIAVEYSLLLDWDRADSHHKGPSAMQDPAIDFRERNFF